MECPGMQPSPHSFEIKYELTFETVDNGLLLSGTINLVRISNF